MRARHFVVYEGDDLMAFSSEEEQLRKFRNDEIAQHYFEVLRTLISKKSIFAQNIGLYDVSYSQVYSWVKKYDSDGEEGLVDKRGHHKLDDEVDELERLRRENVRLKRQLEEKDMTVELLKKVKEFGRM